jgi:hypothetical protein
MASPASTIVVVLRAVVAVVVDALSLSSGLDGVLHVAVGPEAAPNRRCRSSASLPSLSMLGRRQIQAVGGRCSYPPALRVLARGRALCLLCCRRLEQHLQVLAHSSLLAGRRLRETVQQHGRSDKVLRRPSEERRSVSVGIGTDVRALVGASVVVACWPVCRWCWCAAVRLVGSWTTLALVTIPLMGVAPARGCLVQAVGRRVRHPCPALGEERPAPRRAGTTPLQARQTAPAAGRRRRDGAQLALV